MRIVVHGQQAFGKAVLEALLKRGENVVAVYVAPEKEGAKADPLKEAALAAKLPVFQPASYRKPEVWEEFRALKPDLQVMAFVTLFVPDEFLNIPTKGSIQYHPSLLPKYRGPSAINWPIIQGDSETGLSIFWPTTASIPVTCCCRRRRRSPIPTQLGSVYFDRLFPMGVEAMLESVDLVKAGNAPRIKQDHARRPTRAAAARTMPASTGASPGGRSTISSAAAIRRPARGRRSTARRCRCSSRKPLPRATPRASRQDGRDRRGRDRRLHRRLRRRPHQGPARASRRRPKCAAGEFAANAKLNLGTRLS
jgi:methionyl-tRNA formyltransferase